MAVPDELIEQVAELRYIGSKAEAAAFLVELARHVQSGLAVAIHCRMGIGRASMVAAGVLRALGVAGDAALARIAESRGLAVPDTEEQRHWVLRRGG